MNLNVEIGTHSWTNQTIYCNLGSDVANKHILMLGRTGYGKTYAIQKFLYTIASTDCRILILDVTGSMAMYNINPAFLDHIQDRSRFCNVTQEGIPVKLFQQLQLDPETKESIPQAAFRIIDTLKPIFGRADMQALIAHKFSCRMMKFPSSTPASLEKLCNTLHHLDPIINDSSDVLPGKSAANKLSRIVDCNYINEHASEDLFSERSIELLQFQSVPETIQRVLIDILLWDLWSKTMINPDKPPIYIVIDEFQNANLTKSSPLYKIITEGRKFNINCILATQNLAGKYESNIEHALLGAHTKLVFQPSEREVKYTASLLSSDSADERKYRSQLAKLERGHAYIKGDIRIGDTLVKSPVKVSISPIGVT